jgi:hypothetical protein
MLKASIATSIEVFNGEDASKFKVSLILSKDPCTLAIIMCLMLKVALE